MPRFPSASRAAALFAALLLAAAWAAGAQEAAGPAVGHPEDETVLYIRSAGRIVGAVVSDLEGRELRRETYILDAAGDVVDVLVRFSGGETSRTGGWDDKDWARYPDGTLVLRRYTPKGSLESEEVRRDSKTLSRTVYRYEGDPERLASRAEERPETGWKRTVEYGDRGLVAREALQEPGRPVEVSRYTWDDKDRIVEIRITVGHGERRIRYAYGEDGSETEERTDDTGSLVLRIRTEQDGSTVEERFDGGALFARTFRKDGRFIREEIYADGLLVRTREAP